MYLRSGIAALLALGFGLSAAADCALSPELRPASAAGFIEAGSDCLETPPGDLAWNEAAEAALRGLVNQARIERGLKPLAYRPELLGAARFHGLDMAANDFFGHQGARGRKSSERIAAFDRRLLASASAENVAALWGAFDRATAVEQLHTGLMESDGHRRNILAPDMTDFAIGVVERDGGIWVTQVFVSKTGEFDRAVPARLRRGERIDLTAKLSGWSPGGLALRAADQVHNLETGALAPADLHGDMIMSVRGEQPGPVANSTRYMHFTGPAVSLR